MGTGWRILFRGEGLTGLGLGANDQGSATECRDMKAFYMFSTSQSAREYRFANGTGGWIFEDEETREAVLFPPDVTPIAIFNHPLTRGKKGRLLASA